jgi:peptidyl-prolyl cis-trans isomerase C
MIRNRTRFFWVAGCVALVVAAGITYVLVFGGREKLRGGKELARINDRVITVAEFEREMEQLPPNVKTLVIDEKGRKAFLENLIERELLLQEGLKKGLDKNEDILAKVEQFKQGLITEALIEELCAGKDAVSDDEVRTYYEKNRARYLLGERVRVRHIMVQTLEQAREIKKRLREGEDFIALAKQYSIWPTRQQGGDLGYIQRGMVDKAFEQAAFGLRTGEVSGIVKTKYGYHIIRLEDRQKPRQLTFPEVQADVRTFLRDKKRKEILTSHVKALRERGRISINEKLLAAEEGT